MSSGCAGPLAMIVITSIVFGVYATFLGAALAAAVTIFVVLLPFVLPGFIRGFRQALRERKAEDSNPSRASDRTG